MESEETAECKLQVGFKDEAKNCIPINTSWYISREFLTSKYK